jgi:uncharacterized protein (TIGR02996 family)
MLADVLLRAILDAPDDDAPRLIYADWLEEQGDSDRADFIRVQVALARSEVTDTRRVELRKRERALIQRHRQEWIDRLPSFVSSYQFDRGFVDNLIVVAEAFLENADVVFQVAPVRHIKLVGARRLLGALAAEPALARLASLDLSFNGIAMRGLQELAASPYLGNLRALNLCWNPVPDALRVLAGAASLTRLEDLDLEKTGLHPSTLRFLGRSSVYERLTRLSLRNNRLDAVAVEVLATPPGLAHLRQLDLRETSLTAAQGDRLTERFGLDVCRFDD